ncbi:MAG: hypothetical protein U5K29_07225 [Acidimicrobiales bacterium]|nr:hypothetical protein [Acidimicrobiales bacterium]
MSWCTAAATTSEAASPRTASPAPPQARGAAGLERIVAVDAAHLIDRAAAVEF